MHEALKQIGLNKQEIEVYLAILELGKATVLKIARKIDKPRTTIYLIIDSLSAKNLLLVSSAGKRKYFIASAPEKLLDLAKNRQATLVSAISAIEEQLPQLQAIYNAKAGKPKVRYYEGVEAVKEIYEETLSAKGIFVYCMTQNAPKLMGEYLEKYFDRVLRRMIRTKEIVSDSAWDRKYQETYSTPRNEITCLPEKYATNTDYMLFGNKAAFLTYKNNEPFGVVIEDDEIAKFEKIRFLQMWEMVKTGKIR